MREDFVETLVACKPKTGLVILQYFFYILCGITILATFLGFGLGTLSMLIGIGFGALGYFFSTRGDIEYEYTYCDRSLDIAVIFAKSSRKNKASFDLTKLEAMVRVNGSKMNEYAHRDIRAIDFTSGKAENKDNVYALFIDGTFKILIEADEKLLSAIEYACPRKVYRD